MKRFTLAVFALAAFAAVSCAHAQHVFCKVEGEKSGIIRGGTTLKGLEDYLEILSISTGVTSPRDPASGLPTGKRQHQPLTILKVVDKASPLLFQVAFTNENLKQVDCVFYDTTRAGVMRKYFEIKLTNATISETDISGNGQINDGIRETIQFTYEQIQLSDPLTGSIAQDDWTATIQ